MSPHHRHTLATGETLLPENMDIYCSEWKDQEKNTPAHQNKQQSSYLLHVPWSPGGSRCASEQINQLPPSLPVYRNSQAPDECEVCPPTDISIPYFLLSFSLSAFLHCFSPTCFGKSSRSSSISMPSHFRLFTMDRRSLYDQMTYVSLVPTSPLVT